MKYNIVNKCKTWPSASRTQARKVSYFKLYKKAPLLVFIVALWQQKDIVCENFNYLDITVLETQPDR